MIRKPCVWFLSCLALLLLTACTSPSAVRGTFPREIRQGEVMGLVFDEYKFIDEDKNRVTRENFIREEEVNLLNCVADEILKENGDIRVKRGIEVLRDLFPGVPDKKLPKNAAQLLSKLRDQSASHSQTAQKYRYLIVLKNETKEFGDKFDSQGTFGGANSAIYLVRDWERQTVMSAIVHDLNERETTYEATAECKGREGGAWCMGCFGCMPFAVPFAYTTTTETSACEALGKEIGQKIEIVE